MPDGHHTALSPDHAVDQLEALHADAVQAQRDALAARLRATAAASPLFDMDRHARTFADALDAEWARRFSRSPSAPAATG